MWSENEAKDLLFDQPCTDAFKYRSVLFLLIEVDFEAIGWPNGVSPRRGSVER